MFQKLSHKIKVKCFLQELIYFLLVKLKKINYSIHLKINYLNLNKENNYNLNKSYHLQDKILEKQKLKEYRQNNINKLTQMNNIKN